MSINHQLSLIKSAESSNNADNIVNITDVLLIVR